MRSPFVPGKRNAHQPATTGPCASGSLRLAEWCESFRQHEGAVFALAWAPDGGAIFSGGKEGIIRRIDGRAMRSSQHGVRTTTGSTPSP
jgi:hypothetical protein